MALGAGGGRILRNVLTQGLRLVAIGIAIGGALSWMLAQLLRGALAGLSPADPIAFGSAILVLTLTGIAAIYIPARRAAALNPVDALRVE
jgi:ABC-type antimicrobial peptide transport system permease subunit